MSNINKEINSMFIHIPRCAGTAMEALSWNKGSGHDTLSDFNHKHNLNEYYKWTFIRNPWDRILSVYLVDPDNLYISSFSQFIQILHSKKHLFPKDQISWSQAIDTKPIKYIIHFMPMNLMVKVDGKICMDFIGRFENLQEDWIILQKNLKLKPKPLQHYDPFKKGNKEKLQIDYSKFYNKNLIDLVGEIYEEDIRLFNYKIPTFM